MSTRPSSGKQTNKSKDKRSTAEHRHSEDHEQRNLDDAVAYFTNEDSSTKVRNNLPLSLSLETIEDQAKDNGLGTEHIEALVDVAASSRFPDSVNIRLIKSLIPNDKVTAESFLTAVSWMCTNKPSSNVQVCLLLILRLYPCYLRMPQLLCVPYLISQTFNNRSVSVI
ncbi:centromere protein I [Lingula anatina]|uniref:Centromere protein I n=1 Tax=Lingula anatina TaxID=7574 RepID=A0A1S3K587_LINAN|nr:centromere protein I [Lingula anatina]|eukprot:XP_013417579.1 centromere protein I [Lingula anatina]